MLLPHENCSVHWTVPLQFLAFSVLETASPCRICLLSEDPWVGAYVLGRPIYPSHPSTSPRLKITS